MLAVVAHPCDGVVLILQRVLLTLAPVFYKKCFPLQVDKALQSNLTMEAVVRREFQRSFGVDQVQCAPPASLLWPCWPLHGITLLLALNLAVGNLCCLSGHGCEVGPVVQGGCRGLR